MGSVNWDKNRASSVPTVDVFELFKTICCVNHKIYPSKKKKETEIFVLINV